MQGAMLRFKIHITALAVVFLLSTIMALAYTTTWYESRERYIARSKQEVSGRIADLERERSAALEEDRARIDEAIEREREKLDQYEHTLTNTWSERLPCAFGYWWPWVLLTPFILALCRRFPFMRGSLLAAAAVHVLGGPGFGAVKLLIENFALSELYGYTSVSGNIGPGSITLEGTTYWLFVAAYNGSAIYRSFREREVRASRLEAQLARAQLKLLQMQLHPHFLFNTLHAVSTLMARDVSAAERMISRLSDLLRLSLNHIDQQEVPLHEELDFLKCYLDIEQVRFGDRLVWNEEVEPKALSALVPNLILQPIVENAVKHGISRIDATGRIRLRAATCNGSLRIAVSDNGPGLSKLIAEADPHVGLANTRARLNRLYGSKGKIEFHCPKEGGLVVRMEIPFHTRPVSKLKRPIPHEDDKNDHRG